LGNSVAYNLTGNTLNNVLTGNTATNTLNGGAGADTMIGGAGNDSYMAENAADIILENANEGSDFVNVAIAAAGGTYTLAANVENATLTSTVAYNLAGNALDNVLTGNYAANNLVGNEGNDTLNGSFGNDMLTGGLGNDLFVFSNMLSSSNIDTISDFVSGTDRIGLSAGIFTKLLNDRDLSDNLVVTAYGAKAKDANDYLLYNGYTKALYYDADGYGAGAAVQIATLTNTATLSANDFVVI